MKSFQLGFLTLTFKRKSIFEAKNIWAPTISKYLGILLAKIRNPLHIFAFQSCMADVPQEGFACGLFLERNVVQSLEVLNGEQGENKEEKKQRGSGPKASPAQLPAAIERRLKLSSCESHL